MHPYFLSLLSIEVLFNPFSQSSQLKLGILKLYIKNKKIDKIILLMILILKKNQNYTFHDRKNKNYDYKKKIKQKL